MAKRQAFQDTSIPNSYDMGFNDGKSVKDATQGTSLVGHHSLQHVNFADVTKQGTNPLKEGSKGGGSYSEGEGGK